MFSMSYAHFYGSLLYAIPPGRPYSSLEKLFFPFGMSVWLLIFVLFILGLITITILRILSKRAHQFVIGTTNTPFFNMINIFLGGNVTFKTVPMRNFARTMFLIWLLSSLILRNAYQGKLFDNLRGNQRMSPLFRLDEIYESDLKLMLYESFYQNIADLFPNQKYR